MHAASLAWRTCGSPGWTPRCGSQSSKTSIITGQINEIDRVGIVAGPMVGTLPASGSFGPVLRVDPNDEVPAMPSALGMSSKVVKSAGEDVTNAAATGRRGAA